MLVLGVFDGSGRLLVGGVIAVLHHAKKGACCVRHAVGRPAMKRL